MVRHAGTALVFMGVIHTVVAFILFSDQLLSIWTIGIGGGLKWGFGELAAFWFLVFGWLMITMGILIRALADHESGKGVLRIVALSLVAIPILSGLFLPVSGLWLMIIPGVMIIAGQRRH
jgi:Family of unknown function (DUF6463)